MGARVSLKVFGQGSASGGSYVQSGEVTLAVGVNNIVFALPFASVSDIIVQDLDGVGINVDEPESTLSVTGFSVTAFGVGQLTYIVTGVLASGTGKDVQSGQVTLAVGANNIVFPNPFAFVDSVIVQDLNGVGINVDEPQATLTTTGFSVASFGVGPLVYIVTGTFGPVVASSGEVDLVAGANNIVFPIPFSFVSNIIVQDLNGVGINVDEPQSTLSTTGFSVTAAGAGPLVYIVTGIF